MYLLLKRIVYYSNKKIDEINVSFKNSKDRENSSSEIWRINKIYDEIPGDKLIDYSYVTDIRDDEVYNLILFIKRILKDSLSYFEYKDGNYNKILDIIENGKNILNKIIETNPNAIIIGPGDSPAKTIKLLEGIYYSDEKYLPANVRFFNLPLSGRSIKGDIRTANYIRTYLEYNNIEINDENIENIYIIDYVHTGGSKNNIINFFKEIYGYEPKFLSLNNIIDYNSRSLLYGDALGIDFPRCTSKFETNELTEFISESLDNPSFYIDKSGIKYCNIVLLFIFLCINRHNYEKIILNSLKLSNEYKFYTFEQIHKYYYDYLLDVVVISQDYPYTTITLTNVYLDKSFLTDEEIKIFSPNNLSYKYTLYSRYSSSNILYLAPKLTLERNSFVYKYHKYYNKICRLNINNTYIYGIFNDNSPNDQTLLYQFTQISPGYHIDTYYLLTTYIDEIIPYNFLYQNVDKRYLKNIDNQIYKNLITHDADHDYILTFYDLFSNTIVNLYVNIISINNFYNQRFSI